MQVIGKSSLVEWTFLIKTHYEAFHIIFYIKSKLTERKIKSWSIYFGNVYGVQLKALILKLFLPFRTFLHVQLIVLLYAWPAEPGGGEKKGHVPPTFFKSEKMLFSLG
jgi:hypothetical protein